MSKSRKTKSKASPDQYHLPLSDLDLGDWKCPRLADLPDLGNFSRVAFDLETRDPRLKDYGPGYGRPNSYIAGAAIACEGGPSFYLPMRHLNGNSEENVMGWLKDQLRPDRFKGQLIGANFSYDIGWMLQEGIDLTGLRLGCVQATAVLLNDLQPRYSLDTLLKQYGLPGKDKSKLELIAKAYGCTIYDMHLLPAAAVADYGNWDAKGTLEIAKFQDAEVEQEGIEEILALENKVLPVLVKMRHKGVPVNVDKLDQFEAWTGLEQRRCLDEIHRLTGITLDGESMMQATAIKPVFDYLGITLGKTSIGAPQITKAVFKAYDTAIPVQLLYRARKMYTAQSSFIASVREHIRGGRIHCTFNALATDRGDGDDDDDDSGMKGVRFGRLSSEKPNMQQQPSRDDYAKQWRDIYEPEQDTQWAACDYSSQEPRLHMHYCAKLRIASAQPLIDAYRNDPDTDVHQMIADLTGLTRKDSKPVYLGKAYGMGTGKFARSLGLPVAYGVVGKWGEEFPTREGAQTAHPQGKLYEVAGPEAKAVLAQFNGKAPFLDALVYACKQAVQSKGYIRTLLGRKCRFPRKPNGQYDWLHKALNRGTQGSAADQTKKAMVEADAASIDMRIQVHDELGSFVGSAAEARRLADIMESTIQLEVPSKVDIDLGPSWGRAVAIPRHG